MCRGKRDCEKNGENVRGERVRERSNGTLATSTSQSERQASNWRLATPHNKCEGSTGRKHDWPMRCEKRRPFAADQRR
eukprot:2116257-Pleurochrysis_carterae.AAC.2